MGAGREVRFLLYEVVCSRGLWLYVPWVLSFWICCGSLSWCVNGSSGFLRVGSRYLLMASLEPSYRLHLALRVFVGPLPRYTSLPMYFCTNLKSPSEPMSRFAITGMPSIGERPTAGQERALNKELLGMQRAFFQPTYLHLCVDQATLAKKPTVCGMMALPSNIGAVLPPMVYMCARPG